MRSTATSLGIAASVLVSMGVASIWFLVWAGSSENYPAWIFGYIFFLFIFLPLGVIGCVLGVVALIMGIVNSTRPGGLPEEQLDSLKTED